MYNMEQSEVHAYNMKSDTITYMALFPALFVDSIMQNSSQTIKQL